MSFEEIHVLSSPKESRLVLRHQQAEGIAGGIVHINHGLAEHSERYAEFAKALSRAGYHVYAQDHRGHGQNIGANRPKSMFAMRDGATKVLSDVDSVNQLIKERHPRLPVILFGHSMGGLIAFNYALQKPENINGLSIWNSNFGNQSERVFAQFMLKVERMLKGSDVPSQFLPKVTFRAWSKMIQPSRTMFDWLSSDEDGVDAYIKDPLCGFDASVSMWLDILQWMQQGDRPKNWGRLPKNLPINFNAGALDPATNFGQAISSFAARLQQTGFTNITTKIYPHSRHETLLDQERELATHDFIQWADKAVQEYQASQ
ncbi:alpha/beta fold hydrolase [Paenochrobactrum sp. BZR 588]|uniref:alpha/beta fold hydrolase n=1 Tax=unclassified Paenochrobactrum TaxID=2639760 RepID=UPI003852E060